MSNLSNVYLDIDVVNNGGENKILVFTEKRNSAIVKRGSDYNLSVVRFNLSTNLLPMFIPKIINVQTNETAYQFTMKYKTFSITENIIWETQDLTALVNPSQFSVYNNYYYCNSFQYWVGLINKTLNQMFLDLNQSVIDGGETLPYSADLTKAGCFIEYDPTTGNAILFLNKANFVDGIDKVELYANNEAYCMLNNAFNSIEYPGQNDRYKFNVQNNNGLNIYTLLDTQNNEVPFVQSFSEYSISQNWSPVASLVFGSSLTIEPNQLAQFESGNDNLFSSNSLPLSSNILTDLIVYLERGNELIGRVEYTPTAEYRRISINSANPVQDFNINVYWKSVTSGQLVPIQLGPGGFSNIKILFEAKK
jgi:hypothetical protein